MNQLELIRELQGSANLVFCSHDAGGAELLSSFILGNNLSGKFLVSGPATKVFHSKNLLSSQNTISVLPNETSILLSSTGSTDFEYSYMSIAIQLGVRVVAVLDHWVNYRERFIREGENILPDIILVPDDLALKIAKDEFPKIEIILIHNDFLESFEKEYRELGTMPIEYDYVFMCESGSAHSSTKQAVDNNNLSGLEHFFSVLSLMGHNESRILLRPHPSDPEKNYTKFVPRTFPFVTISSARSLPEVLKISNIIVGCNSMALIVAETVGKMVYSVVKDSQHRYLSIGNIALPSEMNKK